MCKVRAADGQGEASTIAVILHDKTRIGEDFQVTNVPQLRMHTAEATREELSVAPKQDHLIWDSSRAPDARRLQQLVKRLHIGSMTDEGRRPVSLLTNADVVEALHRCNYDPASAEASLVALQRRRETKHSRASANSNTRNLQQGGSIITAALVAATSEESATGAVGNGTSDTNARAPGGTSPGNLRDGGGNRWEDWSETDRAAFLMHLGDKHKDMKYVVAEFPAKNHSDIIEFYYNWKFHEPDYSRWQRMKRQIDIALTFPDFHQEICEACEEGGELLLCDTCSLAFHLHCLNPRLEDPPDNDWSCPECLRKHITPESRARAKLFVKQRIVSIEEERRCMAEEEKRRHERQALYGYLGQANAGIEHSNKRGGGASVTNVQNNKDKLMVDQDVEAHAERELSNRPWGKEDVAQLQRAVDEFGERGWRVIMADEKYKSLFHMRSPPIVKSMHRMLKDNDLKRAKARARIAARADTKAKARGESMSGIDGDAAKEGRDCASFAEADAAAAAVAVARTEAHESVNHQGEQAGGTGTFDKTWTRDQRALLQKLVLEHGVAGLATKVEMPAYRSLRGVGSPSVLFNRWRSMQHRLRRRLERQGMMPRRRPGRPPKNPTWQHHVVSQVIAAEHKNPPEHGPIEENSPVPGGSEGGKLSVKRARAEEELGSREASLRLRL
ncbi:unnamed protein product [Scytosiphon promiscuus]